MKSKVSLSILIVAAFFFLFLGLGEVSAYAIDAQTEGTILYVKPGANGDCLSWDTACELQTAIFNAVSGDQIWVAAGTYKPTTSSNREATFQLENGVAIYGGFPAAGGDWVERDWAINITTLSGEIGIIGEVVDNSLHVVTGNGIDGTAVLDGFTITGGYTNYAGGGMVNSASSPSLTNVNFSGNSAGSGGGMFNYSSSPSLTNVTFSGNSAGSGGGMFNAYCSPTLTGVTFSGNTAGNGGGVYNEGSNPLFTNVTFLLNTAADYGGGMFNIASNPTLTDVSFVENSASSGGGIYNGKRTDGASSNPTLTNVTFSSNTVTGNGGGMYNSTSNPALTDVTFSGNSALNGGGIYNHYYSIPFMKNITFSNNTATNDGGGIYNMQAVSSLTDVSFNENSAGQNGGGMYSTATSINLSSVTLSGNSASGKGGGMYNSGFRNSMLTNVTFFGNHAFNGGGMYNSGSSPNLTNVTFSQNSANNGGGMYNAKGDFYSSNPTLINTILWGNTPNQITNINSSTTITYSVIQGGYPGTGNLSTDPLLLPIADNGGFTQTLALDAESPAIDVANPSVCPNFDQRIYARPIDGDGDGLAICDIGAYEFGSAIDAFTLNMHVFGSGTVVVDPSKPGYQYGEVVTLQATADVNWVFTGWSGDASGTENPLTLVMDSIKDVNANFTDDTWTLNVSVTPEDTGFVTIDPLKDTYPYGDVVTLTATANPGWSFAGWSGDASGTDNPLTLTMLADKSITANFTQNEYLLTVSITPSEAGLVSKSPSKPYYHYGELVTLSPVPNPGWTFTGWGGDVTGADNPLTLTIENNTNITAYFTQEEYTLTVNVNPSGMGSVAIDPVKSTYHYGDLVTLTATAEPYWALTSWSGDISGFDNPLTFMIEGNTIINANFSDEFFLSVLVNPTGMGSVTVEPVKPMYQYGDVVSLTPTANPGWTFSGWTGNSTGSDIPLLHIITGNTTITANFTQDEYILTVGVNPTDSGTVTIEPMQATYHYGDVVMVAAGASPGWTFSGWSGDVTDTVNPLTVTIQGNTYITANFTQDEYTLAVLPAPEGKGFVSISPLQETYHYGDVVTLTAAAIPGWSFGSWGGEASGSINPLEYTVTGNTSITAAFTQDEYLLTLNLTHPDSGTVTIEPLQTTYHYGDVVTFTAASNPGWDFDGWSGDAISLDNPLSFTIYGNSSINADFTQIEYSLLVDVSPLSEGTITVTPLQASYHYGDVVTLTATGIPGWSFSGWSGGNTGAVNPLVLTIIEDTSVTANFTQDEYLLNVSQVGSGTVVVSPIQTTYYYGDVVSMTATATPGWTFADWSGDVTSAENPLSFSITGNTNITATFTQNEYQLSVAIDNPESASVNIEPLKATYHYGDVVTLTVTSNPGWTFTGWSGDASGIDNPLTFSVTGNVGLTANFVQNEYTLTVVATPVEGGSVSVEPAKVTYHYGDVVALTAVANPGWTFSGWSGDAIGADNPLTITINGDINITAVFTQDEYLLTLNMTHPDSGTIIIEPLQTTYHYGEVVTLTATSNPGWDFDGWSGDAISLDNPLTFTIYGNSSINANFTQIEYSLHVEVSPLGKGSVIVSPSQATYHYGDIVTLTPSAIPGWSFAGWSGDASGTDNPLTFTIEGNTSITANLTLIDYTLAVGIEPEGKGSVLIDPVKNTYHYGDVVTLTASGIPGWSFSGWGGDYTGMDNPLVLTIQGSVNITANFTQDEYTLLVTINPEGKGSVVVTPEQATYHYGDVVTLTPSAISGWSFGSWDGDATGTENPLVFTISGNTSITANFTQNEYTLTVLVSPADSGAVSVDPVKDTYHYGDIVTLTAMPNDNWLFDSWSGDINGTENPLTVTIEENTNIIANFIVDEWSLNVSVTPEGMGSVTVDPLKESYQFGDEVTLTATAIPGWSFAGWSGDAEGMDNPLSITIDGNTSITANFTQDEYVLTITIEPVDAGSVSVTPVKDTYHYGDEVTLTAIPGADWSFGSWSGDFYSLDNPFTITITGDTGLSANFNWVFRLYMPLITRN